MAKKKITTEDLAIEIRKGFAKNRAEVEDLAVMINRGFENTVSKREFTDFKEETKGFQKVTLEEFGRLNAEIHDIKIALGPLARIAGDHEREIQELRFRMHRLERKVGLPK